MVIWILGLSGSGKTSLAIKIINKSKKNKFLHIDGDSIRNIYEKKLGHTMRDRQINASRISKLVKYISDQKVNVIVSVLSNFPEWLKWNRKNIKNYFEVYLKTDLDILKNRRSKLYSKKVKNVIGVDLKFNEPIKPDIIIKNSNNKNDIEINAIKILKKIKR